MTPPRRGKPGKALWIVLGALAAVPLYIIATSWDASRLRKAPLAPGVPIAREQIEAVAAGIAEFEGRHSRRPVRLEALVGEGIVSRETLLAERPSELGRKGPDYLYFPFVRKSDPAELVLVCSITLQERGQKYHVVRNDGQYVAMNPAELVAALNRTYAVCAPAGGSPAPASASTPARSAD